MAGEWIASCLRDEADLLTGFPFKSAGYTEATDGLRLLRGDNIVQAALRWDGVKRWPKETAQEFSDYALAAGDVVLAMDRPWIEAGLKFAAISPVDLPCLLVQRTARIRGGNSLDTGFLRYLIGSRQFTQHVLAVQTGTTVPHISARQILDFEFLLPPLPEQKRIAHILGTLDDKIELNRRMNATLEAMARAIFKSWFVDFDPVRQKEAGKQPVGMDAETAALFPDSFEDSEIGEVPKGWEVGRWGEIATLEYGKGLRDYGGDRARYTVYGTNGPIGTHHEALAPGPGIIVGRKGAYRGIHYSREPFFVIDTAFYLRPLCSMEMRWAYYELLRTDLNELDSGSAIPSTSRESFYGIRVTLPPTAIQRAFCRETDRGHGLQGENQVLSRTLAALRDSLLPKLLSGEIRIPDAEEAVEEAVR